MTVKLNKIHCPDFGTIEILDTLPTDRLIKILRPRTDDKRAFKELIAEHIQKRTFNITKFSEGDLDCISEFLAIIYNVKAIYVSHRNSGLSRESALLKAIRRNSRIRAFLSIRIAFFQPTVAELIKERLTAFNSLTHSVLKSQEIIESFSATKSMMAEISKSLANTQLITQRWNELTFGHALAKNYAINAIDIRKAIEPLILKMDYSVQWRNLFQKMVEELTASTVSISKTLKEVYKIQSSTIEAFKYLENVEKDYASLFKSFEQSYSVFRKSENLVLETNQYFVNAYKVKFQFPKIRPQRFLKAQAGKLLKITDECEELLQDDSNLVIQSAGELAVSITKRIEKLEIKVDELGRKHEPLFQKMDLFTNPGTFKENLKYFAKILSKDNWELFWDKKGEKFVTYPERIAQGLLGCYLEGHCPGIAFIGKEIKVGRGYIDLFVNFFGYEHIVEIKVVGPKWSIGGAERGLAQLDYYMEKYQKNKSYLLIIDGRKTLKGRQLGNYCSRKHGNIDVINAKII